MKRSPPILHLEHALYRGFKSALLRTSHSGVRRFGRRLGSLVYYLDRPRRRLALSNMASVLPEIAAHERPLLVRQSCRHHIAAFCEAVSAERFDEAEIEERFDVEGFENLRRAEAGGRGFMLVTGHFGTYEMSIYPAAMHLGEFHMVVHPVPNLLIRRDVERIRGRFGSTVLPHRGSVRKLLRLLRNGKRLGMVIDQHVLPNRGILVPFLGRPAWTTPLPAYLSLRTGAPVVPAFCVPAEGGRYHVTVLPPIEPQGSGEGALPRLTQRYLEPLEQRIRQAPELWFWIHRRWQLTQRFRRPVALNRIRARSQLPPDMSWEQLGRCDLPPEVSNRLQELARGDFLERSANILTVGGAGTGKTLCACALGDALLRRGHTVLFSPSSRPLDRILAASNEADPARAFLWLDRFELLILDDVDHGESSAEFPDLLLRVMSQRRGRRSTLITCRQLSAPLRELIQEAPDGQGIDPAGRDRWIVLELGGG